MKILAIIPARGGSKGIPRKNIYPFCGKPLIYWTIQSAIQSEMISRVIVSTDDEEIADVARQAGAETPFMRTAELADDDVTDYPVIRDCVERLDREHHFLADLVVQLRPTSPLRPAGLIDQGINNLISCDNADSLRVVCEPQNNPFKMWSIAGRFMTPLVKTAVSEAYNQPRQLLPPVFWQIGTLDVIRKETIFEQNSLSGKNILPMIVSSDLAVDIDDLNSLKRAESVFRQHQLNGEHN
ncbi:acylneuraminate cytidylyltransferase family protein [Arenicellales bacterium IMCC58067]